MTLQHVDVAIIGGGHAGIEAALASARVGCRVLLCTLSKETIGLMPCNPSIGGPAKGQIVGEIDALGGQMGRTADATHLQLKILNRSRGPAVQCLRAQSDKVRYQQEMATLICSHPAITVLTTEVHDIHIENNRVCGLMTEQHGYIHTSSLVVTAGTFLKAIMHTGPTQSAGGRLNEKSCTALSTRLAAHFKLGRLKTGTPPRLAANSIDYSRLLIQPGDNEWLHFSFKTTPNTHYQTQLPCYRAETNTRTHDIIFKNLDRSPLFTKTIKGVGARYCPSIEDKIVRFKDKPSHHIFIEPESRSLNSIYPQGLNTSLPHDVQEAMLRSMHGLEEVRILKWGYAVEYDFVLPSQLHPTLETQSVNGLFFAGQLNGTSGYEEAAGQGLIAGANAALQVQNRPPFIVSREDSYIGTLIDDLIHKSIAEPYRMLTSRSEYRLLLRQDNACERLSEKAYQSGLLCATDIAQIRKRLAYKHHVVASWKKGRTTPQQVDTFGLRHKISLYDFAKRNDVVLDDLLPHDTSLADKETAYGALIDIRYAGYIAKQQLTIEKMNDWKDKPIPSTLDIDAIPGLRNESREHLKEKRPKTFYAASRIAGINPADLSILLLYLSKLPGTQRP